MWNKKNSDSDDDFGFYDDEDEDITESADKGKSSLASEDKRSAQTVSLSSAKTKAGFDLDGLIKTLLSTKVRNIGTSPDQLREETIIKLIDAATDIVTS